MVKHFVITLAAACFLLQGCSSKEDEFSCKIPQFKQENVKKKQRVRYSQIKTEDCEVVDMLREESAKAKQPVQL